MSRDGTWVVSPFTEFEHDTTYRLELGRLQFSIDRQRKSQFLRFLTVKGGGQISNLIFLTPKRREGRTMTY